MNYIFFALTGYVIGSMLFSYRLPLLFKGIDVREKSQDHNPGVYNAFKYSGVPTGVVCLMLDVLKGALPVMAAVRFCDPWSLAFAAVLSAPVLGHAFSLFHRFSGGKAIAVSFGVLIGLFPRLYPLAAQCVFFILFSTVIVIRPNSRRAVYTYAFTLAANAVFLALGVIGPGVFVGCLVISAVCAYKNRTPKKAETEKTVEEKQVSGA